MGLKERVVEIFSFTDPDKELKETLEEVRDEVRVCSNGGLHQGSFILEINNYKVGVAYDGGGIKALKIISRLSEKRQA